MENTFVTSRGMNVTVLPISTLIEKQRASFDARRPKPPTYEVKTATGVTEVHEHNATTLETNAEKMAWAEYQAKVSEHEIVYQQAFIKLLLTRGINVALPDLDTWAKEQEWLGIDIPTDANERRFHYVWTEIIGDPIADLEGITLTIGRLSHVPEAAIAEAEATFRGRVGDANSTSTTGQIAQ
jgi:hypothetical protein